MTKEQIAAYNKLTKEAAHALPKTEILKALNEDELYYGTFGQHWFSNSFLTKMLEDPELTAEEKLWGNGSALVIGNFVHKLFLEPEKAKVFPYSEATHRSQTQYKEDLAASDFDRWMFLEKDFVKWNQFKEDVLSNPEVGPLIYDEDNEFEVPLIGDFNGLPIKGKCDIINHKKKMVIDLKTTSDLNSFAEKVDDWNYNVQACVYAKALSDDYTFRFIAVDKRTTRVGVFDISPKEFERGMNKLYRCANLYKHYHTDKSKIIYYHYL